jgi:hypothetical protein
MPVRSGPVGGVRMDLKVPTANLQRNNSAVWEHGPFEKPRCTDHAIWGDRKH